MKRGMTPEKWDYGDPLWKTIPSTGSIPNYQHYFAWHLCPDTATTTTGTSCPLLHAGDARSTRQRCGVPHHGCCRGSTSIPSPPQKLVPRRDQPRGRASLRPVQLRRQLAAGWQEGPTAGTRGWRGRWIHPRSQNKAKHLLVSRVALPVLTGACFQKYSHYFHVKHQLMRLILHPALCCVTPALPASCRTGVTATGAGIFSGSGPGKQLHEMRYY